MCGLAINIMSFTNLLKKVGFDLIVDHLVLTHIMRSKMEPATTRMKRLLEVLSSYLFDLYSIKGKDMIFSDSLSRQKIDNSTRHQIIPMSFCMRNVLQDRYYNKGSVRCTKDKYLVQTRSQSISSGIELPEVHRVKKGIDPHVEPKRQTLKHKIESPEVKTIIKKPILGQCRAGLKRKIQGRN